MLCFHPFAVADDGAWGVDILRNAWVASARPDEVQYDAPTIDVLQKPDHYLSPDEARALSAALLSACELAGDALLAATRTVGE